jgi:hypothetical protein
LAATSAALSSFFLWRGEIFGRLPAAHDTHTGTSTQANRNISVGKKMYYIVVYIQRRAAVDQSVYMCGRVACWRTTHTNRTTEHTTRPCRVCQRGGRRPYSKNKFFIIGERETHTIDNHLYIRLCFFLFL